MYNPPKPGSPNHQPTHGTQALISPLAFPNDYNSGLCGCFSDCKSCLDGFFCEYCDIGYQSKKLMTGRGGEMDFVVCCGLCCCDLFCCKGLAIAGYSGCKLRPDINERFGISESFACACLKGCCCHPCSNCQTHREMNMRLYGPGGVCSDIVHVGPPLTAANPYPQAQATPQTLQNGMYVGVPVAPQQKIL